MCLCICGFSSVKRLLCSRTSGSFFVGLVLRKTNGAMTRNGLFSRRELLRVRVLCVKVERVLVWVCAKEFRWSRCLRLMGRDNGIILSSPLFFLSFTFSWTFVNDLIVHEGDWFLTFPNVIFLSSLFRSRLISRKRGMFVRFQARFRCSSMNEYSVLVQLECKNGYVVLRSTYLAPLSWPPNVRRPGFWTTARLAKCVARIAAAKSVQLRGARRAGRER